MNLRISGTDLYVPFMNTKNGQKLFSYHGCHILNRLKPISKNVASLFAFILLEYDILG